MRNSSKKVLKMGNGSFLRQMHVVRTFIIGLMLLAVGCGVGYGIGRLNNIQPQSEKLAQVGNIGETSILPDTIVQWTYEFDCCEHTLNESGPQGYVGKSIKDIQNDYPDADISVADDKSVSIVLSINEYCPNHYILMCADIDTLCVFRTSNESMTTEQILQVDYAIDEFDSALLEQLENGLVFDSMEAINAYLESVET